MQSLKIRQSIFVKIFFAPLLVLMGVPHGLFAQKHGGGGGAHPAPSAPARSSSGAASGSASAGSKTSTGPTTSGTHGPGTTTASHGPTANSSAGRGPTANSTAGRGPTANSTAGRSPTTNPTAGRGAAPSTAGRGIAAASGGGRAAAPASSHSVPKGSSVTHTKSGNDVRMRAGGKPADVHVANRGMDIHHGLSGNRRVAVDRPDHSRVVAERGGRGYVQRPYSFRGREFDHRTYWAHGRAYDRFYGRYPYRGAFLDVYAPEFYYNPAFYGWAYNPWIAPVPYAWGFAAAPWYGYYGFYFTPYPVYPSASVWLTDYLISTSLADAYEARANAAAPTTKNAPPPANAAALTPQVKDQIAAEVQRQIALENVEARSTAQNAAPPDPASSGIQRMLSDNVQHVFIAGRDLDVVDASGTECALSDGDALQLTAPPPANAAEVTLTVLSNKGGVECKAGAKVSVAMPDLQDMQNHMRELIDQGMGELQSKQGKGGLPPLPSSAAAAPLKAPFGAAAPPPEPNVAAEIQQQAQDADKAETEALSEVPAPSGPSAASAAPVGPALGQTVAAVVASLGQPLRVVELGPKKIYVYKDQKITFADGKVADITKTQ